MSNSTRRTFLKLMGSGAMVASLPASISKALAIPANHRTGTIKDVEHIVILTQENRSFDHYFGTMRGVRGFGDPRPIKLASGKSVWHQPNGAGDVLPFRPPVDDLGLTFMPDPPHGWNDGHAAWNQGRHDQYVPNKGMTAMTYHTRADLPYHFALADAFTVCDAYYCSLMGPTDPNRYHLFSGWVGNDGGTMPNQFQPNGNGIAPNGPVVSNAEEGYNWRTYPERLQDAGIRWKFYQDIGDGLFQSADGSVWWGWTSDPYIGNYGDNSLLYFLQYQNAQPGSPLHEAARTGTEIKAQGRDPLKLLDIFREDVKNNHLPQVSYIAAPEAYTEHPVWPANWGAWYISQFIDALVANPEVWSKTVLIINYDEEGGFFDHMPMPTPPFQGQGASTVDTVDEVFPGNAARTAGPYGLGMRVPLIVVSPWSKGGYVNSQVFDHTSIIRFLEARFADEYPNLIESNITPWRRAVAGDLTSVFDFARPDARKVKLPGTPAYLDHVRPHLNGAMPAIVDPVPPANQAMPVQEPGVRPARALPYEMDAQGGFRGSRDKFYIDFTNTGKATVVFHVRSANGDLPRSYTVEPGKRLSDAWHVDAAGYDLSVHGPNGFYRSFAGGQPADGKSKLNVKIHYDSKRGSIALKLVNSGGDDLAIRVFDRYSRKTLRLELDAGHGKSQSWSLEKQFAWYDLVVTLDGDSRFREQLAGHVETGRDSFSDPLLGRTS